MKIAILGRTSMLVRTAWLLQKSGHQIVFVGTTKPAEFYDSGYSAFEELARECGAKYRQAGDINAEEYVADLSGCGAEIGISVNWPMLMGRAPISAFKFGVLNAHAGDLPRYRGNACPNWAIINDESHIGLCVHQMCPDQLDSGPVLARDTFFLSNDTYIEEVYSWLETAVPKLFLRAVEGIANGLLIPVPQPDDPALSLRCYPRRPEDARIQWQNPVKAIYRLVRASSRPFAGAFTFLEGQRRMIVWRALPAEVPPFVAVPGQVMSLENGRIRVACGEGCLDIEEYELEDPVHDELTVRLGMRSRFV